MNSGKTIYAQLMDFVAIYEFRKIIERYDGNFKITIIGTEGLRAGFGKLDRGISGNLA